jgi:hypothetical protein
LYKTYRFEDLHLKASQKTPEVSLNRENGEFRLEGRLYPENPFAFFDTINVWMDYYLSLNPSSLDMFIDVSYYNTTSSKLFLNFLKKVVSFSNDNFKLKICWQYNTQDEEMRKTIINFSNLLDFPITMIEEKDDVI